MNVRDDLEVKGKSYNDAVSDVDQARDDLYRTIRRAARLKNPLSRREIARLTGLSFQRVQQIIEEGA